MIRQRWIGRVGVCVGTVVAGVFALAPPAEAIPHPPALDGWLLGHGSVRRTCTSLLAFCQPTAARCGSQGWMAMATGPVPCQACTGLDLTAECQALLDTGLDDWALSNGAVPLSTLGEANVPSTASIVEMAGVPTGPSSGTVGMAGLLETAEVWAAGGQAGPSCLPLAVATQRASWDANGARVGSIDEYVYERFLPYGRFLDASCGHTPLQRVALAFEGDASAGTAPMYAVGTRLQHYEQEQAQTMPWCKPGGFGCIALPYCLTHDCWGDNFTDAGGDPMPFVDFGRQHGTEKNPFFALSPQMAAALMQANPTVAANMPGSLGDPAALAAVIDAGNHVYPTPFKTTATWHRERWQDAVAAGYDEATLAHAADLVARWRETWARRVQLARAVCPDDKAAGPLTACTAYQFWLTIKDNPVFAGGWTGPVPTNPTDPVGLVQLQRADLMMAGIDNMNAWEAAMNKANHDAAVLLLEAAAMGCLDPTGTTPCDWTPQEFLDDLRDSFGQAMLDADRAMEQATGGDFSALLTYRPMLPDGSCLPAWTEAYGVCFPGKFGVPICLTPCPTHDLTATPALAASFLDWRAQFDTALQDYLAGVAAEASELVGADGHLHPPYIAWSWGFDEGIDDPFRLGASAHAAFSAGVLNLSGGPGGTPDPIDTPEELAAIVAPGASCPACNLFPFADASFDLDAHLGPLDLSVVHALGRIDNEKVRVELELVGHSICDGTCVDETVPLDAASPTPFTLLHDGWDDGAEFATPLGVITIGPVVLRIQAGLGMSIGFDANATAAFGCQGAELTLAELQGSLVPWARTDAFVEVSAGAVVVEGYVRGDVTLAKLKLPLDADLTLGLDNGVTLCSQLVLRFGLHASLEPEFLSGRVRAGVRLGICPLCKRFEGVIVDWKGFSKHIPIIDWNLDLPLVDLATLASSL